VILTVLRFSQAGASLSEAKGFIYLFAGYFLLRGMFCRASRADTLAFLKALVVVNTIAAALFIVHQGLHITVYSVTEYQTLTFMGERITRSFYFMPQLLTLALAYTFAKRRWSIFWIGVIVVTLGALWVSYTRSLLIIALVELVAILGARLFKGQQAGLVVKRALTIVVLAAVLGVVAWVALPVQSQYFVSRISAATSSGSLTGDPNLQNRENKIRRTYEWIADSGHLVGQGFVTASQDFHVAEIEVMSSDLVWVPVLYRLGLIGVVLVMLLYLAGGWRAAKLSMAEDPDAEFLGLVLFGLMVGTFLEGAVSWTFLNPARYPMGFWVFALLAAEACRRRAERAAEVAGVEAGGSAAGPGMGIAARPPRGGSHA
jgi:O-antigen ligase